MNEIVERCPFVSRSDDKLHKSTMFTSDGLIFCFIVLSFSTDCIILVYMLYHDPCTSNNAMFKTEKFSKKTR